MNITPLCRRTFSAWEDISFLWAGVPLQQVSRCIVTTAASKTAWGAVCNGHAASGVWTGHGLHWHINCLELLTVLLALRRFRPLIQGKHMLVWTDNAATVAYINHQGGVRSHRPPSLTLEPSQTQVSACHSYTGRPQSCSGSPLMTGLAQRRVEDSPPKRFS